VAAAPQAERDRVMGILKRVKPVSLRLPGVGVDGRPKPHRLPLETISAPTLIVCARDDSFDTLPRAELAARQIPGARLVAFDTGGHLLVGRLQEVRAAVRAFLDDAGLIPAVLDMHPGE
jgi:2-hydroxy-6-oxonona-2,4-dienedioate hydrolase